MPSSIRLKKRNPMHPTNHNSMAVNVWAEQNDFFLHNSISKLKAHFFLVTFWWCRNNCQVHRHDDQQECDDHPGPLSAVMRDDKADPRYKNEHGRWNIKLILKNLFDSLTWKIYVCRILLTCRMNGALWRSRWISTPVTEKFQPQLSTMIVSFWPIISTLIWKKCTFHWNHIKMFKMTILFLPNIEEFFEIWNYKINFQWKWLYLKISTINIIHY